MKSVPVSVQLMPTKTYTRRMASWSPAQKVGRNIGVLTVIEGKGQSDVRRRYAVTEVDPVVAGQRRFRVTKPLDQQNLKDECYWVCLAHNPESDLCDCKGFEAGGWCTHTQSLRALVHVGHLPQPSPHPAPTARTRKPSPTTGKPRGKARPT